MNDTVTITAKYHFTDAEKRVNGERLAQFEIEKGEVMDAKKIAAQRFNEKIETIQQSINTLSMNLSNGYEYREYQCRVDFDTKKKRKSYFDIHTNEKVDERDFEQADYQRKLAI